jgi:glycosyltransferase involved in cell wall biosynthesis
MSKVSILIPTYNRADLLPATLDSALSQTYRDIEVIVSDNASTDNTPELMQAYVERDHRVKYIRRSLNEGPIVNYSTAWNAAVGDYVAFLDSDDLFHPTKIERQLQAFGARPSDTGFVHTGFCYIDRHGKPLSRTVMLPEGDLFEPLLRYQAPIWFGAVLFTRKCIERTGWLDASVAQAADVDYLLRATRLGYRAGCVQEALYSHRHHGNNQSNNITGLAKSLFTIYERIYAEPDVAAKYKPWRNYTFANLHLDCVGRFLASGQYESAGWHIAQALTLQPEWKQTLQPWVQSLLYEYALGPTCDDLVAFVGGLFDSLPQDVPYLLQHRGLVFALAHVGTGLRAFYSGNTQEGRDHIVCALKHYPELPNRPAEFIELVCHFSSKLPVDDPGHFASSIFDQLPDSAKQLRGVRSRVLSKINLARAFYAWAARDLPRVRRQVIAAIRHRPSAALNRGVMSIFTRSIAIPAFNSSLQPSG